MMEWSLISLILILMQHAIPTTCHDDAEKDAKFIILGGGIAGLAAAKHLKSKGENDYILLEGDSRIGGRVKTATLGTYTVEVGAGWFNSLTSPIGLLAQEAGVTSQTSDYEDYVFRNDSGQDVTNLADDRYDAFSEGFDYLNGLSEMLESDDPFKPDIPQRAALARGGWRPETGIDYAIEYYDMDFTYGHPTESTSTRFGFIPSLGDADGYTEDVVIDQNGGLTNIIQHLRDDAFEANDARLKLNHKITDIISDSKGVVVKAANGLNYTAHYVIMTFSLGVLQNEVVTFDPPLPEWKQYSIFGATFVTDIPIYIKFPADTPAFWDQTEFILHTSERRGYYILIQNFNKLIPDSKILQFQVSGHEGRRISRLTDDQVKEEIKNVLNKMYQEVIPDFEVIVPRWYTDPLFHGCYSDWGPHFSGASHRDLRAPVGHIYFAGEAYHNEYYGYMEGAYFSAVNEIDGLLACEKNSTSCERHDPEYETRGCVSNAPRTVMSALVLLANMFMFRL